MPPHPPAPFAACLMPSPRAPLALWPRLAGTGWGWGLSVPQGVDRALDWQGRVGHRVPGLGCRPAPSALAGQQALLRSLMELASISRHGVGGGGAVTGNSPPWPLYLAPQNTGRKHSSLLSPAGSVQTLGSLHPSLVLNSPAKAKWPPTPTLCSAQAEHPPQRMLGEPLVLGDSEWEPPG